jgi:hypothetical protein
MLPQWHSWWPWQREATNKSGWRIAWPACPWVRSSYGGERGYGVDAKEYVAFRSLPDGRKTTGLPCRRSTRVTLAQLSRCFGLCHRDSSANLVRPVKKSTREKTRRTVGSLHSPNRTRRQKTEHPSDFGQVCRKLGVFRIKLARSRRHPRHPFRHICLSQEWIGREKTPIERSHQDVRRVADLQGRDLRKRSNPGTPARILSNRR